YSADLVTKTQNAAGAEVDSKEGILGVGASYTISGSGVSIDAQFLSFDKSKGTKLAGDTNDITSEIVVGAGYKIDKANVGASYNIYGKASNIALTASTEIVQGANLKIRADIPGTDYAKGPDGKKDTADDIENVIGIYLGTEF
ncbi:MAG: hypothetical protein HY934_07350, partial [Candidatus Firestonebacteria bacterium]|nr:hypothetical protein [Candidatus Firestonebacteria bacterium]